MREMFLSIRPKLLAKTIKADMKKLMPFLLLFCYLNTAFAADDVVNTPTENTIVQNTTSLSSSVDSAKDWNLTESEWASYLALMRGSAGYYYSQLTPPEILGHYAKDAPEMRHFAEIHAKLEHDRIEREIKFNNAFHDAALKLYPDEPIIKPFDMSAYTPIPKSPSREVR